MQVNIIHDGLTSTVLLLEQVILKMEGVDKINKVCLPENKKINLYGINIFCRNCLPGYHDFPKLISNKVNYIYYLDDNFLEIDGDDPVSQYHRHPLVIKSFLSFLGNAKLVITSTERLKDYLLKNKLNSNVISLPNFVDFELYNRLEKDEATSKKCFRIGYAGSAKDKAFSPVLDALTRVRSLGYEFDIEFVGWKPTTNLRINYFPYQDNYKDYAQLVFERDWDLALAPFEESYFWSFKTDNKYREYSALKIPAVYSNVEPYNSSVNNYKTGILTENTTESWLENILFAIKNNDKLVNISKEAHQDCKKRYNLDNVVCQWDSAISLIDFYINSNDTYRILVSNDYRWKIYLFYLRRFWIEYKYKGFISAINKSLKFVLGKSK